MLLASIPVSLLCEFLSVFDLNDCGGLTQPEGKLPPGCSLTFPQQDQGGNQKANQEKPVGGKPA